MEYKILLSVHCCDLADLLFQTVKTGATRNAHNPRIRSAARPRESVISRQINNSGSSSVTRNFSNWVTLVRHFGFGSLSPRPCFLTPIARPLSSSARTLCFSSVVFASLRRLLFLRTTSVSSLTSLHIILTKIYTNLDTKQCIWIVLWVRLWMAVRLSLYLYNSRLENQTHCLIGLIGLGIFQRS